MSSFAQRMTMIIITLRTAAITEQYFCQGKSCWSAVARLLDGTLSLSIFFFSFFSGAIFYFEFSVTMKIIYNIYRFYVAEIRTSFGKDLVIVMCSSCSFARSLSLSLSYRISSIWFIGRYFIFFLHIRLHSKTLPVSSVRLRAHADPYRYFRMTGDGLVSLLFGTPMCHCYFRFSTLNLFLHFACDVCLFRFWCMREREEDALKILQQCLLLLFFFLSFWQFARPVFSLLDKSKGDWTVIALTVVSQIVV